MKLIASKKKPQPPDLQTLITALLQRAAIEVENAPASYFGQGFYLGDVQPIPTKKVGRDE